MKTKILISLMALAFTFGACSDPLGNNGNGNNNGNVGNNGNNGKQTISQAVYDVDPPTKWCGGEPFEVRLLAGMGGGAGNGNGNGNGSTGTEAGKVWVVNDADYLYVTYETTDGWMMKKVHLFVGDEKDLPNPPSPGQFPYKSGNLNNVTSYTIKIPLGEVGLEGENTCAKVAAHAELIKDNGNGTFLTPTGWGEGTDWGHDNWAMFFEFCKKECTGTTGGGFGNSFGSVTATNDVNFPLVVPNSNHFTYAVLSRADLEAGVTLDLVVGNKIDFVGNLDVKLVGNEIEIELLGGTGKWGAVAFDYLPNPANGNIHANNNLFGFKHDNKLEIDCPAGDPIYLYVHFSWYTQPPALP